MSAAFLTISPGEDISCRRQKWVAASGQAFDTITAQCGPIAVQGDVGEMVRFRDELTRAIGDAAPAVECVRQPACTVVDQPDGGGPR